MPTNNLLLLNISTELVTDNHQPKHSASPVTFASFPPLSQCGTFQMLSFPSRPPRLVFPLMFVLSGCQREEPGRSTSGPPASGAV